LDPYAGLIANTAPPGVSPAGSLASAAPPETSLAEKWRGYGPREFARRGLRKAARILGRLLPLPAGRCAAAEAPPETRLVDARSVAQLRAVTWLLGHADDIEACRRKTQALRRRSDREIFERFPLAVVPTYPGDRRLFATEAFSQALRGAPVRRYRLEDLLEESG
ncbi:MAG: hypothetical protein AAF725_21565, partial [Acidobacteriota bacterium]